MNASDSIKSRIKWKLVALFLILVTSVSIAIYRHRVRSTLERMQQPTTAEERFAKFSTKFLERVSFPQEYNGQPSPDAPPEKRQQIIEVHSRYWKNFTPIDRIRFRYSFRKFHNGKPDPTEWDMDAQVEMRYGYGIEVEGTDSDGEYFHKALNPEGRLFPRATSGDLSSLMLSMFAANRAWPDKCKLFADMEENVPGQDELAGRTFDVLIVPTNSQVPGHTAEFIESKYWFDRETGMLTKIEYVDPYAKEQFGYHPYKRFEYTQIDGVYLTTRITSDHPEKGNRFVETYDDLEIHKRSM